MNTTLFLVVLSSVVVLLSIGAFPRLWEEMLTHLLHTLHLVLQFIADAWTRASEYSRKILTMTLRSELSAEEQAYVWPGLPVLVRLLFLVTASAALLADYGIARLRVPSVSLPDLPVNPISGLPLDSLSGLLYVMLGILWGMLFLEFIEVVPPAARLFTSIKPYARVIMLIFTIVGMLATAVNVGLLFYVSSVLAQGGSFPEGTELVNVLQGTLLYLVLIPGIWGATLGLQGLASLASWVVMLLCAIFAWLFSSLAKVVQHMAENILPRVIHVLAGLLQMLLPFLRGRRMRFHGGTPIGEKTPDTTPYEEVEVDRITSLAGVGTAARRFLPKLITHIQDLAISTTTLRTVGIADTAPDEDTTPLPLRDRGVEDVSTSIGETRQAFAITNTRLEAEQVLINKLVSRLVDAHTGTTFTDANLLWVMDAKTIAPSISALETLHSRLPHHLITPICFLPEADEWEEYATLFQELHRLRNEGVITTTLVISPKSPLARKSGIGEERQEHLVARSLAGFLLAHTHHSHNQRFSEMAQLLGKRSPFVGMALEVTGTVSGQEVRWYRLMRRFTKGQARGMGDLNDMRLQAQSRTQALSIDTSSATVSVALTSDTNTLFLNYLVPLRANDTRFSQFVASMRSWLIATLPSARATFVHGTGYPLPQIADPYVLQVGCLYGIGPLTWIRPELASPLPEQERV
jgi:hypothetical protein